MSESALSCPSGTMFMMKWVGEICCCFNRKGMISQMPYPFSCRRAICSCMASVMPRVQSTFALGDVQATHWKQQPAPRWPFPTRWGTQSRLMVILCMAETLCVASKCARRDCYHSTTQYFMSGLTFTLCKEANRISRVKCNMLVGAFNGALFPQELCWSSFMLHVNQPNAVTPVFVTNTGLYFDRDLILEPAMKLKKSSSFKPLKSKINTCLSTGLVRTYTRVSWKM